MRAEQPQRPALLELQRRRSSHQRRIVEVHDVEAALGDDPRERRSRREMAGLLAPKRGENACTTPEWVQPQPGRRLVGALTSTTGGAKRIDVVDDVDLVAALEQCTRQAVDVDGVAAEAMWAEEGRHHAEPHRLPSTLTPCV